MKLDSASLTLYLLLDDLREYVYWAPINFDLLAADATTFHQDPINLHNLTTFNFSAARVIAV